MLKAVLIILILACSPVIQAETIEQAMRTYNEICMRWDKTKPGSYKPSDIVSRFEALEQTTDWSTMKIRCRYNIAQISSGENKDTTAARENLIKVLEIYDKEIKTTETLYSGVGKHYAAMALSDLYDLSEAIKASRAAYRTRLVREFFDTPSAAQFINERNTSLYAGRVDYQTWVDEVRAFVLEAKQLRPTDLDCIASGISMGQTKQRGNFKETLELMRVVEKAAESQAGMLQSPEWKRFLEEKQKVEEQAN